MLLSRGVGNLSMKSRPLYVYAYLNIISGYYLHEFGIFAK